MLYCYCSCCCTHLIFRNVEFEQVGTGAEGGDVRQVAFGEIANKQSRAGEDRKIIEDLNRPDRDAQYLVQLFGIFFAALVCRKVCWTAANYIKSYRIEWATHVSLRLQDQILVESFQKPLSQCRLDCLSVPPPGVPLEVVLHLLLQRKQPLVNQHPLRRRHDGRACVAVLP